MVLLERSAELGGQLIAASAPEFKSDVARYLEYLRGDLERSDVEVRLSIEDARGEVLAERPDAVVVATGGRPAVPDIPGIEGEDVMTAANVLTGDVETGERVVVAGGGVVGCETALFLESAGREVVLLEEGAILSSEPVFPLNFMKLSAMIDESTIQVHTGTKLLAVQPAGVVVERAGEKAEIECDSVVLALGTEPVSVPELEAAAMSVGARLLVAGEAAGSSKVLGAVWDGFDAGRVL